MISLECIVLAYCLQGGSSENERDAAFESLRKGAHLEVTRFKGLGEISPKEFGQFIGSNMRAVPVGVEHSHEIPDLLNFYMGSNTSYRRQYIMENLV